MNEAQKSKRDESSLLWKNLEFIFMNVTVKGENGKRITKDEYVKSILHISKGTYENYKHNVSTPERITSIKKVADGVSELIRIDAGLSVLFPLGVTASQLMSQDLSEMKESDERASFTDKVIGTYLCYYNSTEVVGHRSKHLHYGVIKISEDKGKAVCSGIFAIESLACARNIHQLILDGKDFSEVSSKQVFTGEASVTRNLLWLTFANRSGSEFVSVSFDLEAVIYERNADAPFKGARGIALTQSSGVSARTVTMPMIIKKTPIAASSETIERYLSFSGKRADKRSVEDLVYNIITLSDSISGLAGADELRPKLLSRLVENTIETIIKEEVYSFHYFSRGETDSFYRDILLEEI